MLHPTQMLVRFFNAWLRYFFAIRTTKLQKIRKTLWSWTTDHLNTVFSTGHCIGVEHILQWIHWLWLLWARRSSLSELCKHSLFSLSQNKIASHTCYVPPATGQSLSDSAHPKSPQERKMNPDAQKINKKCANIIFNLQPPQLDISETSARLQPDLTHTSALAQWRVRSRALSLAISPFHFFEFFSKLSQSKPIQFRIVFETFAIESKPTQAAISIRFRIPSNSNLDTNSSHNSSLSWNRTRIRTTIRARAEIESNWIELKSNRIEFCSRSARARRRPL